MSHRLKHLWQRLMPGLEMLRSHHRLKSISRLVGIGLLLLSFVFMAFLIIESWSEVRPHLAEISPIAVGLAALSTFGALMMGGAMWYFIQRGVGIPAGWSASITIHLLSNITKYAPGMAWQYISKGFLTQRQGVPAQRNVLALMTEFILLLCGGILVGSLAAWRIGEVTIVHWLVPQWIWGTILLIATAIIAGWYVVLWRSFVDPIYRPQWIPYIAAVLIGIFGWISFALAVWFLVGAFVSISLEGALYCLFALVFAGTISILIIFVPGGFGVREASLAILLAGLLPIPLGVVVGILLRLILIGCEIVGFGLALMLSKRSSSGVILKYLVWGSHKNTSSEVL